MNDNSDNKYQSQIIIMIASDQGTNLPSILFCLEQVFTMLFKDKIVIAILGVPIFNLC